MAVLDVKNLKKIYRPRFGGNQVQALSCVNFSVEEGEYVAIMGESGSGKTTLLNIMAALDKPTEGTVLLDGKPLSSIKDKDIAQFRRDNLGFVFQEFNLLDTFNVKDNILLPLVLKGENYKHMDSKLQPIAKELAERFHGNIGLALDAATDAAYQAEADRQQAVLTAMVSGNEYALIKALSAYEGKKQEIYNLLDCLSETVRDAVILKSGENDLISSFPAEAEKLTHCITVSQGVQLNELFSQIKKQLDFNGNIPLTLLALGGKIKDITEK